MADLLSDAQDNSSNASTMWIFYCCWNRTIDSKQESTFLGRNVNTGNNDLFKPGIHFLSSCCSDYERAQEGRINLMSFGKIQLGNALVIRVNNGELVCVKSSDGQDQFYGPGLHKIPGTGLDVEERISVLSESVKSFNSGTLINIPPNRQAIVTNLQTNKREAISGLHFIDNSRRIDHILPSQQQSLEVTVDITSANQEQAKQVVDVQWEIDDAILAAHAIELDSKTFDSRGMAERLQSSVLSIKRNIEIITSGKIREHYQSQIFAPLGGGAQLRFDAQTHHSSSLASASASPLNAPHTQTSEIPTAVVACRPLESSTLVGQINELLPSAFGVKVTLITPHQLQLGSETQHLIESINGARASRMTAEIENTIKLQAAESVKQQTMVESQMKNQQLLAEAEGKQQAQAIENETILAAMKTEAQAKANAEKIEAEGSSQAKAIMSKAEAEAIKTVGDARYTVYEKMSGNPLASERTGLEGVKDVMANLPDNTQVTAEQLALPSLLSGLGIRQRRSEADDIAGSNAAQSSALNG